MATWVECAGTPRTTGPDPAVAVLLALIDEGFDRRSWHGTNLRGSLRCGARAARGTASGRSSPTPPTGSTPCGDRLTGEKRGSFTLPGSNFFPAPTTATKAAWRDNVALLTGEHRTLRDTIRRLTDRDLAKQLGGQDTVGGLVRGVAAHDLYHAGQIQLIKRLMR